VGTGTPEPEHQPVSIKTTRLGMGLFRALEDPVPDGLAPPDSSLYRPRALRAAGSAGRLSNQLI
jgi:hypothetical protein